MKDIATICSEDEVMAFDETSVAPPSNQQHALFLSKPVISPGSASYDSGYSSLSPTACPEQSPSSLVMNSMSSPAPFAPSASFVPSSPASFAPSTSFVPSSSGGFMSAPSPSSLFVPSPSSSYAPSPSTSYTPSPSAAFAGSPSTSFTPSPFTPLTPETSPLSPMVTIKREVESPQPEPPEQCQSAQFLSPPQSGPMRSSSPGKTVSGNMLPPCRICFDKASGFHYGLNTCEACKGFFRRSLKRGVSYVCTRDGKCDVTGERRNLCGYCRYQKCIALGMSKKAIKTGRYTHAKRTRDTLEIKKLMRRDVVDEEEDLDFDAIIAQVIKAHDDYVISSTRVPSKEIKDKQQLRYEKVNLEAKHFGEMTNLSSKEYQDIFEMTGMDIDNRQELMKFHVKNSERWIRGYIDFAKKLPGFRELSLPDQANLVKYARIEFWFLGSFPGYNSELGVAVMPNGRCFTRTEMYNVWQTKYIDVAFDLARRLQKLQVTPEEMIIVKAICLTAGDRCVFVEPEKVAMVQWRMVRCLQYLLKKRCSSHADFVNIFSHIFVCLTDLRDLNEAEYQTIQNTQLYRLFTESPLMMEVLPY